MNAFATDMQICSSYRSQVCALQWRMMMMVLMGINNSNRGIWSMDYRRLMSVKSSLLISRKRQKYFMIYIQGDMFDYSCNNIPSTLSMLISLISSLLLYYHLNSELFNLLTSSRAYIYCVEASSSIISSNNNNNGNERGEIYSIP